MDESSPATGAEHPVEVITRALQELLRVGVRPAQMVRYLDLFPDAVILAADDLSPGDTTDPYLRALNLADRITAAVRSLGEGATGLATQALFGVTPEARGQLLKHRRRIAADQLGIMTSTFRSYYEDNIVADVALVVWTANHHS
ncbi:MAG TPA: hypothetical protein VHA73_10090 [Acidimicrobiales bacterium]|nr:hypothetical protein [Acidimicrobiales bacterium]